MKTPRNTDITGNTYNYLTVIEKTSQKRSSSYLWKCQCKCGNFILARKCELESGHTKSCGCFHIEQFKKSNANRAKDLKYNGKYLRFDFYVDNKYLIEYDGRQHFILDNGYGADLENIQKRDQIKNDYAKSHNIPLIRIPYTEFDSFGIEDLILKESEEDRVK